MKRIMILIALLFTTNVLAEPPKMIKINCDELFPYSYKENGMVEGFSVDVVSNVLKSMGIGMNTLDIASKNVNLSLIKEGQVDLFLPAGYSLEDSSNAIATDTPIFTSSWKMYINSSKASSYKHFTDIKGKKVGLVKGVTYPTKFIKLLEESATVEYVDNNTDNVRKLLKSKVDVIVMEEFIGDHLISIMDISRKLTSIKEPISDVEFYPWFSKETIGSDFVKTFNEELVIFKTTQTYKNLIKKHLFR